MTSLSTWYLMSINIFMMTTKAYVECNPGDQELVFYPCEDVKTLGDLVAWNKYEAT